MNIIRLLLFVLLGLFARRVYLFVKGLGRSAGPRTAAPPEVPDPGLKDLTEQDISDADFEEIP